MNQFHEKITEGKRLLRENRFPGEIIESVKDTKDRKLIKTAIFSYDVPFHEATPRQKEWRSKLLPVQLAHIKYLLAKDKYRATAVILFMLGFITFVTAFVRMNENINFGITSMIIGSVLYAISFWQKWLFENIGLVCLALVVLTGIEYIAFGWPQTYMEFMYHSPHFGAAMQKQEVGGTISVILNESTPIMYLSGKLMIIYLLFNIYLKQRVYFGKRAFFEEKA